MKILWAYGGALAVAGILSAVFQWLWSGRSALVKADAERFVREIADAKAADDPIGIIARARELVAQWDAVQGRTPSG